MTLIVLVGLLAGGGLAAVGLMRVRQVDETLSGRLGRFELKPAGSLTELELQMPRGERLLGPMRRRMARTVRQLTPVGTIEKIQTRLAQAGNPNDLTVQDFLGLKGLFAVGLGLLAFVVFTLLLHPGFFKFIFFTILAVVAGFFFPNFWLSRKIKERREQIERYLPDAIDILAISVEAGQGFDGALETLSARKHNSLTEEFDRFRLEVQAGKARRDALRDLALRADVEDLKAFTAAVIQSDQLGIGISQVLKTQSEELRIKRRQRAEIKARQAPIKMLFPLIFLMFPSLFIVILGPSLPAFSRLGTAGG